MPSLLWPFLPRPFTGSSDPPPEHSQPSDPPHPQNIPCTPSLAQTPVCLPGDAAPFALLSQLAKDFLSPLQKALTSRQGMLSTSQKCRLCQLSHYRAITSHSTRGKQQSELSPCTAASCKHWMERSARSDSGVSLPTLGFPKTHPVL